ncbi:MAG TPA: histidine phosphatase family protein [Burkholderiales bacterium]|jgi:probable phosphoglycerate mutase|nr:histidine phosphatase family protein [Burkholderiales bacterium]
MSDTVLTLVRHGETQWNAAGRIQGHLDIPLSAPGLAQAAAIGERLGGEAFDAILSSDLERALQTARPIVRHSEQTLVRDARLRERHLGVLQGLTGEEAAIRQPHAWGAFKARNPEAALEGGETLDEFSRRVVGLIDELMRVHAGSRLLLVTHGGVLDAAYRHATGMPPNVPRDFPIYNASVNILRHRDSVWTIESWGDVSHLPLELAMDDT